MSPGRSPLLVALICPPKFVLLVGQYGARVPSFADQEASHEAGARRGGVEVLPVGDVLREQVRRVAVRGLQAHVRQADALNLADRTARDSALVSHVSTGSILLAPCCSLAISSTSPEW